ncbi:CBM20 domain-containing protein [Entamoeba marina]
MTKIIFNVNYFTNENEVIALTGSCSELGSWNSSIPLNYCIGNNWTKEILIKTFPVEYKYQLINKNGEIIKWEATANRILNCLATTICIKVTDTWEQPSISHSEIKQMKQTVCLKRSNSKEWKLSTED